MPEIRAFSFQQADDGIDGVLLLFRKFRKPIIELVRKFYLAAHDDYNPKVIQLTSCIKAQDSGATESGWNGESSRKRGARRAPVLLDRSPAFRFPASRPAVLAWVRIPVGGFGLGLGCFFRFRDRFGLALGFR